MDTEFSVSFGSSETDAELCGAAAAVLFARIDEIELLLSRFNDSSDVAVIGALADGETAVVARETMDALAIAARVAAATAGAYDPTVAARNFAELTLDAAHLLVGVRRGPVRLDFGGIGKGYALDECAKILRSEQFELRDWLLDAGTSTQLASGGPWRLGAGGRWKARTRLDTVVTLSEGAFSGSGFEIQGAHVLDVRRGGPATRWAQAWARARTAAEADALSTAALALEPAEIERACAMLGAAVLVAREQRPAWDRFRDPLRWFSAREAKKVSCSPPLDVLS